MRAFVVLLICSWVLFSCGSPSDNQNNNNNSVDYSMKQTTSSKAFEVSYGVIKDSEGKAYESIPFNKIFSFAVTVKSLKGSPVDSKTMLSLDAMMPEHKHGMNTKAKVSEGKDGTFTITGLLFHMPGLWTITVSIPGTEGSNDTATFNVMMKL